MANILVVDDEKSIRITLREFLRNEGYAVEVAEDVDQALDLLKQTEFDVVVTDIILPRINGVDLLKAIRAISSNIQVIMMTGEPTVETASESLRQGAFDYLYKPISKTAIIKSVRNALHIKELSDEKIRLEEEKRQYLMNLEEIVEERTKALQQSEARLRVILDSVPVAVMMISADKHKIVDVNPKMALMSGLTRESLIGTMCHESVCPFSYSDCPFKSFGEINVTFEHILQHADKTEIPVLKTISNLTLGEQNYFMISMVDISERKKLEKQLVQAQKMEAIGSLAGGIAHDFNNILASVIGFTELALDREIEGSQQHSNLNSVLTASLRAKDLVHHILTFSRQSDTEKKPVMVHLLVKEALKLLRASLPSTIQINESIQTESVVLGDSTQIHQVIMNLCTNAFHAMKETGGILSIKLEDMQVEPKGEMNNQDLRPGLYTVLSITDTGHGMSAEILNKIFDPFFTTKNKGEGTGMGLSIVHGIIHAHEGAVFAESIPGETTCFTVYLPAFQEQPLLENYKPDPLYLGTERILLIDDEPQVLAMAKQTLESFGYTVTAESNSTDALERFKGNQDKFDIIITDLTMPHMTGDVLAQEVMRAKPNMPVILFTGFSDRMDEKSSKEIGIRAFVRKPFLKKELGEAVRAAMDQPS